MTFVGQVPIVTQLHHLLPVIYAEKLPHNFLLRGPSGYGKTTLALEMLKFLSGPHNQICLGSNLSFDPSVWVHFIDEVHLMKPPEILYPLMDSGKYVIILASNDAELLTEALVNRCTQLVFGDYSLEELQMIARGVLKFPLRDECVSYIIEASANNPRIIKSLIIRLNIISRQYNMNHNMTLGEFKNLVRDIFGIEDGLDVTARRYLDVLQRLGGKASLERISSMLHVDQSTVRYYVEPILLYKSAIQITSKGRSLV